MKRIIHIQHCESVHHTNGMVGSSTDWLLSEKGVKQAHNIGKKLKNEINGNYVIYSSDLKRAKMTAEIVKEHLHFSLILDERLRERHLGEAVGKSVDWARSHGAAYSHSIDHIPFVGSETVREHYQRVSDFLKEVLDVEEDNIILVSHGGTKAVFQFAFLEIDIERANQISIHSSAGSISKYIIQDDGFRRVETIGDTSYRND